MPTYTSQGLIVFGLLLASQSFCLNIHFAIVAVPKLIYETLRRLVIKSTTVFTIHEIFARPLRKAC